MKKFMARLVGLLFVAMFIAQSISIKSDAYGVSDWVLVGNVPVEAEIVNRKWCYTKTTYLDSTQSNYSGYTLLGSDWVQSGQGSANYATFPSGFDTSHWIYTSFYKSVPYSAYENATNKRTVSNGWSGYVYWHWMYDTAKAKGTSTRAIYNKKGTGPDNGFWYQYFGAFTSSNGNYSSDKYYCNSQNLTNYIIPEKTAWVDCQGATRWFRFSYYTSTYTDYKKMYHYKKVEKLESDSPITSSSSATEVIDNVQEYVKYKDTFTVQFNSNGGSGGPASQTKSYGVPLTITQQIPQREGYEFLGWSGSPNDLAPSYYPGGSYVSNSDITLYALWDKKAKYTVTYDWTTNGGDSGSQERTEVYVGDNADLSITATRSGWEFLGWNTTPSATTGLKQYSVNANTTLYAIFRKTVQANLYVGDKTLLTTLMGYRFAADEAAALVFPEIPAYLNWNPVSWTSEDGTDYSLGETIYAPDSMDIYAKYCRDVTLSYDVNGGSAAPPSQDITVFYFANGSLGGDKPQLAAAPQREGYVFDKWAINSEDGARYAAGDSLYITEDTVAFATWTELPPVQTPVISVTDTAYGKEVELSCAAEAAVYYTLDGTSPTTSSSQYRAPIRLSTAGEFEVKAFAVCKGYSDSDVVRAVISIPQMAPPVATPDSGILPRNSSVSLQAEDDAEIYYTLDGSTPTTEDIRYEAPIPIDEALELNAIAVKYGCAASECSTYQYELIPLYTVDTYGYHFLNASESFGYQNTAPSLLNFCIPYSSVKLIFGDSVKGKSVYASMASYRWTGNCCGMAATSALFFSERTSNIATAEFGVHTVFDLNVSDFSSSHNNLTVRAFIEAMQASQYTLQFSKDYSNNRRYNEDLQNGETLNMLYDTVTADLKNGEPAIIAIGKSGMGAHALLAYDMIDVSQYESHLYVYDCNYPSNTQKYIKLLRNAEGNITQWSYLMGGYYGEWGTEASGTCYISFIPFETIQYIWANAGNLFEDYMTLTVNSDNVAIYTYSEEEPIEVGAFIDGEFCSNREDIFAIPDLTLSEKGALSVYLPKDFYVVSNENSGIFEASMVADTLGATVSTTSQTVCFGIDETMRSNEVWIENATKTSKISLDSSFISTDNTAVFKNVVITAQGTGETLTLISSPSGITASNCSIGSYIINGHEQINYYISASSGAGGSIDPVGDVTVPAGGKQSYQITPDPGYQIKEVVVDGISYGALTEYTFDNVQRNHAIRVTFERAYEVKGLQLADGCVTVHLSNLYPSYLWVATYSSDGRMLTISGKEAAANATSISIALAEGLPKNYTVKVFLTKNSRETSPLCASKSIQSN